MAKEVYIDESECTACESCVDMLPEVFEMTDNDTCRVKDPNGASEDKIQEVIDDCPAECIHWKE